TTVLGASTRTPPTLGALRGATQGARRCTARYTGSGTTEAGSNLRSPVSAHSSPLRGPEQSLDEATLRRLVRRQIDAGINFLVPCGTTGESPTLTREEHLRVVQITLEE